MNKNDIYEYMKKENIWFEVTEHKAVYNMEELASVELPYPEADAKNLFVRDDKKKNYYLITVKGDKRVDLKEFKEKYGTRRLSFASENDLMNIMGLIPGAVTPFGILNDSEKKVQIYIDKDWMKEAVINIIKNAIEHSRENGEIDDLAFYVTEDELSTLTLELMRIIRETIICLSLCVHEEERKRHPDKDKKMIMSVPLMEYDDDWKI